jgi:hypothetical protein
MLSQKISSVRNSSKGDDFQGNTDNQLDATIKVYNNSNQLNMFRAMISPIFRSIRLCLQLVV